MMSAPMVQVGGPPMHPGMPPQQPPPPPPQQGHIQNQIEPKYDNFQRVRSLSWNLKDSVTNLIKVAAARVTHMAAGKTTEEPPPRFDKTLEDFFSTCNQIEFHMRAIMENSMLHKHSVQYLPLPVALGKQDASFVPSQDGNLSYTQYISTTKIQVNFTKSVQELLADGVRNVVKNEV